MKSPSGDTMGPWEPHPCLPWVLAGYSCLANLSAVLSLKWDISDVEAGILQAAGGTDWVGAAGPSGCCPVNG